MKWKVVIIFFQSNYIGIIARQTSPYKSTKETCREKGAQKRQEERRNENRNVYITHHPSNRARCRAGRFSELKNAQNHETVVNQGNGFASVGRHPSKLRRRRLLEGRILADIVDRSSQDAGFVEERI